MLLVVLVGRSRGRLGPGVLTGLLMWSLWVATSTWSADPSTAFYGLHTRAWQFLLGAVLTYVPIVRVVSWPAATAGIRAGALAGLVGLAVTGDSALGLSGSVVASATTGLLLVVPAATNDPSAAVLTAPTMRWIGDRSYSWYLWHWPVIVLVGAWAPGAPTSTLGAALSLVLATLAFRFIEQPPRLRGWHAGDGRRHLIATSIVAAGCLAVAAAVGTTPTDAGGFARASAPHADELRGCSSPEPLGAGAGRDCRWPVPGAHGEVVLVGDSTAGMLVEPVVAAAAELGLATTVATFQGCPFANVSVTRSNIVDPRCNAFVSRTIDALIDEPPVLVVVSVATDVYLTRPRLRVHLTSDAAATSEVALLTGLETTLGMLTDAGMTVLLVETIPKFEPWTLAACSTLRLRWSPDACAVSATRADADIARGRATRLERAAAAAAGARTVDLADALCGTRCPTRRDGIWLYRDGGHLSVDGAVLMTSPMRTAIAAAM